MDSVIPVFVSIVCFILFFMGLRELINEVSVAYEMKLG